jgi:hypothetical protein
MEANNEVKNNAKNARLGRAIPVMLLSLTGIAIVAFTSQNVLIGVSSNIQGGLILGLMAILIYTGLKA